MNSDIFIDRYFPKIIRLYKTIFVQFKAFLRNKNLPEIGWLIFGQALSIILGFVSMKLLSKMGTNEFGKYSLVLSMSALCSAVIYGPIEQGFMRYFYEYLNIGKSRTYLNVFYKFLLGAGFFCLLLTFLVMLLSSFIELNVKIIEIFIMGLYIIISTSSNIYNSMLNVLRKRKINTILQIAERILVIVFLFLMTLNVSNTANNALLAILLALFIIVFVKTKVLNHYISNDIIGSNDNLINYESKIVKDIMFFSLPFAIWGLTSWMQSNSERWVIAKFLSTSDVGIYSLMIGLANYLIAIPSGILSQFAQPIIYEKASLDEDLTEGIKILKYLIIAIILLIIFSTFVSIVLGKQIVILVSNMEFSTYWYILPILCVGVGVFQIGQALTTVGILQNLPRKYLFPKIFTGLFAVVSNILFINCFGINGIALSICLTSFVYLALVFFVNKKIKSYS